MENLVTLENISLPTGDAALLFLYLLIGIYTIFSGILYYHWKTHGTNVKVTSLTFIVYFSSTLPLLLLMIFTVNFI